LINDIYRRFYETYRLGPADELAIRVFGHPDYSLDRVKIMPTGRIYHPLLGEVEVARLTLDQLARRLSTELSEYIINPKVTVSLLEAKSAKIGVLGEVLKPGIVLMAEPMTVLDAIYASGGFADSGNRSHVTLIRQLGDGRLQTTKVNLKRILDGKASPEENLALQAGDTVIVHGNVKKAISYFTSLAGFSSFLTFIARR